MGDEVDYDFTVRCGLEDRPVGFELMSKHLGIDQIAVVSQS